MDPVAEALARAIERWCAPAPGTFGLGTTLSNLWAQSNGGAVPYDPDGIEGLVDSIRQEPLFANCGQMADLEDFLRGDDRTVGDLFNFLQPCAEA